MKTLQVVSVLALLACGAGTPDASTSAPRPEGRAPERARERPFPPLPDFPGGGSPQLAALRVRVRHVLAAPPTLEPPYDLDRVNSFMQGPGTRWLQSCGDALRALTPLAAALTSRAERVVAHAYVAWLAESAARWLSAIPIPTEVAADRELLDIFVAGRDRGAAGAFDQARDAYGRCVDEGAASADWGSFCAQRLRGLPAVAVQSPTGASERPEAQWPAECEYQSVDAAPLTFPPGARVAVAVVPRDRGTPWTDAEWDQLLEAAHRRLVRDGVANLIDVAEVRAARRSVEVWRMPDRGRACMQPPTIEQVLSARHPHLISARVDADCSGPTGEQSCRASIVLVDSRGRRRDDLHRGLGQDLGVIVPSHGALVAAMDRLEPLPSEQYGIVGVYREPANRFRIGYVHGVGDWAPHDPAPVVRSAEWSIGGCRDRGPAPADSGVSIVLVVAGSGNVDEVVVRGAIGAARERCITDAVRRLRFPAAAGNPFRRVVISVSFGGDGPPSDVGYRVQGSADEDPALRAGDMLHRWELREAVVACQRAAFTDPYAQVSSWRLRAHLGPTGAPERVVVDAINSFAAEAPTATACIEAAVRRHGWPCPSDPRGADVEVILCAGNRAPP